jgi:hypothetical protein
MEAVDVKASTLDARRPGWRLAQIDWAFETAAKLGDDRRNARCGRCLRGRQGRSRGFASSADPECGRLFGVTDPEVAIRWLVLPMTLSCDPLAIALTAAEPRGGRF